LQKHIFNKISTFFFILIPLVLILGTITGCEDKKTTHDENTPSIKSKTYSLTDSKEKTYNVELSQTNLIMSTIKEPVVLIHLLPVNCVRCPSQIETLRKLKNKFKNKIYINHFFIDKETNPENIIFFTHLKQVLKLDNTIVLPLTVLYKNGKYFSHTEGIIPIEMLTYSIQEAIKK